MLEFRQHQSSKGCKFEGAMSTNPRRSWFQFNEVSKNVIASESQIDLQGGLQTAAQSQSYFNKMLKMIETRRNEWKEFKEPFHEINAFKRKQPCSEPTMYWRLLKYVSHLLWPLLSLSWFAHSMWHDCSIKLLLLRHSLHALGFCSGLVFKKKCC